MFEGASNIRPRSQITAKSAKSTRKKAASELCLDAKLACVSEESKNLKASCDTIGLNGLYQDQASSKVCLLLQSRELLPKVKKTTTFHNAMFAPTILPQQSKEKFDVSFDNTVDMLSCEQTISSVLGRYRSLDCDGLLRSSNSFSRSVPRLDTLMSHNPLTDRFSLRSSESTNFLSMDSLLPSLSYNEGTTENQCNGRPKIAKSYASPRSPGELSPCLNVQEQLGRDNFCYLNESYENPLLYSRVNSEVSQSGVYLENNSINLLLVGGFDDNFIPSNSCLSISHCQIQSAINMNESFATVTTFDGNSETRL